MRITTKHAYRISFPYLFEPATPPSNSNDGKPRYGLVAMIPKGDALYDEIKKAFATEAREKWGAKGEQIMNACLADKISSALRDGDLTMVDAFRNHWVLHCYRAESSGRPMVVDRKKSPIAATDGLIYPGVHCNIVFDTWLQDNTSGKGLRAGLIGVQFVKHDVPLGGAAAASADEFDILEDEDFDALA